MRCRQAANHLTPRLRLLALGDVGTTSCELELEQGIGTRSASSKPVSEEVEAGASTDALVIVAAGMVTDGLLAVRPDAARDTGSVGTNCLEAVFAGNGYTEVCVVASTLNRCAVRVVPSWRTIMVPMDGEVSKVSD